MLRSLSTWPDSLIPSCDSCLGSNRCLRTETTSDPTPRLPRRRPFIPPVTAHNCSRHPSSEHRAPPPSRDSRDCQPQSIRSFWFFFRTLARQVDEESCRRTPTSKTHPSRALMRNASRTHETNDCVPRFDHPRDWLRDRGSIPTGSPERLGGIVFNQHIGRTQGVVHGRADSADPGGSTSRPVSQSSNQRRTQLSTPASHRPFLGPCGREHERGGDSSRGRSPSALQATSSHWSARYENNLYYWTGSKDL